MLGLLLWTLKINSQIFYQLRGFISKGIAAPDKQTRAKTMGKSNKQRRIMLLYREKGKIERGCFKGKAIGGKPGLRVVTVSHWLNCWAGKHILLPPAEVGKAVSTCKVPHLFLLRSVFVLPAEVCN